MREVCDFSEWTECTRAMHENGRGGVAQKQVFGSCAKTASIVSINFTYAHLDMRK